jgi:hypothetical protein
LGFHAQGTFQATPSCTTRPDFGRLAEADIHPGLGPITLGWASKTVGHLKKLHEKYLA